MNSDAFRVWDKTYSFIQRPLFYLGEQVIYDKAFSKNAIHIIPNAIAQEISFIYSGENDTVFIYDATYKDFMELLTVVLSKSDKSLCCVDIDYHDNDRYVGIFDGHEEVPVMEFDGAELREALLKVWIGLNRAHQGYSLGLNEDLVNSLVKNWRVSPQELDLVLEGLYHYGIAIFINNLLNRYQIIGFDNAVHLLNPVFIKALAYGMTALSDSDTVLKFGVERSWVYYPDLPNIRRWSPYPEVVKWEDVQ